MKACREFVEDSRQAFSIICDHKIKCLQIMFLEEISIYNITEKSMVNLHKKILERLHFRSHVLYFIRHICHVIPFFHTTKNMLNSILAYVTFNIKALLKNKISFVWSVALPLVMFWIDKDAISSEVELIYWWVYMVLCSYIYGIGLYALELRESGSLRTIFSIQHSSWSFFLGNLLTQILFCIISIGIFDIVVIIAKGFSITHILFYSIYTILVCIPFAFLSYVVTLLPSVHADTIRTIFSVVIFGMFMLLSTDLAINRYNPMFYISQMLMQKTMNNLILYSIVSLVSIALGMLGIIKFEPGSNERR